MQKIYKELNNKLKTKFFLMELIKKNNTTKFITFVNPFSYDIFLKDSKMIKEFDVFFADGALLVKLHNLFNKNKIERVSFDFSSIATDVLNYVNENNTSLAVIGAKEEELKGAISNLKILYPNLNIIYSRNGYFNNESDYRECFEEMKNFKIDILIIGMGSPYQEKFAVRVKKEKLNIPLVFTCGGFLTQTSIKADYYHPLVKKFGLRWLQRAIMHKHVRDRLLKDYPLFVIKYIYNHLKK